MNELRVGTRRRHERDGTAPHWPLAAAWWCLWAGWQLVRLAICAVLVLGEPIVRALLVPVAFLSFLVTLIFGFLVGDARLPRWGMLAFSVGTLMLYWLYLGLMSLFMTLPHRHGHHR